MVLNALEVDRIDVVPEAQFLEVVACETAIEGMTLEGVTEVVVLEEAVLEVGQDLLVVTRPEEIHRSDHHPESGDSRGLLSTESDRGHHSLRNGAVSPHPSMIVGNVLRHLPNGRDLLRRYGRDSKDAHTHLLEIMGRQDFRGRIITDQLPGSVPALQFGALDMSLVLSLLFRLGVLRLQFTLIDWYLLARSLLPPVLASFLRHLLSIEIDRHPAKYIRHPSQSHHPMINFPSAHLLVGTNRHFSVRGKTYVTILYLLLGQLRMHKRVGLKAMVTKMAIPVLLPMAQAALTTTGPTLVMPLPNHHLRQSPCPLTIAPAA